MQFSINKIAYNVLEPYPKNEEISVSITAKFGVSTQDNSKRAFFLELNIDGEDVEGENEEGGNETRNLIVVARLNYQLDKISFPELDINQIEEDEKYFLDLLQRLNETVINITSQDDRARPLNINKSVEKYKKEFH
jgi:hypothetical protein